MAEFINPSRSFPICDAVIYGPRVFETVLTGIPDGADVESAREMISGDGVRLLAIAPDQSAASVIREHPGRYQHLFTCRESCDVYRLR